MSDDFWDLSKRPYTKLKLKILSEYVDSWATILFKTASEHKDWCGYHVLYYVDCYAGRGKYHDSEKSNSIDGSPLIALECAKRFNEKYKSKDVQMRCVFVEQNKKVADELATFCLPYKDIVNFKLFGGVDFNEKADEILAETNYHPAFFFVDPDGIKELKKDSVEKIVNRKCATDILLNYIKGGVERIVGLAKKGGADVVKSSGPGKYIKTPKSLRRFLWIGSL